MDLTVVLPARNEEVALPGVITDLAAAFDRHAIRGEVLVVDDGSDDATPQVLRALAGPRLRVISFPATRGRAHGLAAGMAAARGAVVALMDADGQYDPEDLPALVAALEAGADLANGVRVERRDDAARRGVSRAYNLAVMRLACGVRVRDANSGLKAIRAAAIPRLGFDPQGMRRGHRFLVAQAVRRGLRVAEVPVRHRDRAGGASYIRPWREARHTVHDLVVFRRRMRAVAPAEAPPAVEAS